MHLLKQEHPAPAPVRIVSCPKKKGLFQALLTELRHLLPGFRAAGKTRRTRLRAVETLPVRAKLVLVRSHGQLPCTPCPRPLSL